MKYIETMPLYLLVCCLLDDDALRRESVSSTPLSSLKTDEYKRITYKPTQHRLNAAHGIKTSSKSQATWFIRILEIDHRNRARAERIRNSPSTPSSNYSSLSNVELYTLCARRNIQLPGIGGDGDQWTIHALQEYVRQNSHATQQTQLVHDQRSETRRPRDSFPRPMLPVTPTRPQQTESITSRDFFPERSLPAITIRPQQTENSIPWFPERRLPLPSSPFTPSPRTYTYTVTPLKRQHPFL